MMQELIDRLDAEFPEVAIYMDDVPQNLNLPAFFLQVVDVSLAREFQGRYWYRALFSLTYVPDEGTETFELAGVLDELLWTVEELSPTRRATEVEGRITDGTASVIVGYEQMKRKKLPVEVYMETLRQTFRTNRRVRHGKG